MRRTSLIAFHGVRPLSTIISPSVSGGTGARLQQADEPRGPMLKRVLGERTTPRRFADRPPLRIVRDQVAIAVDRFLRGADDHDFFPRFEPALDAAVRIADDARAHHRELER